MLAPPFGAAVILRGTGATTGDPPSSDGFGVLSSTCCMDRFHVMLQHIYACSLLLLMVIHPTILTLYMSR